MLDDPHARTLLQRAATLASCHQGEALQLLEGKLVLSPTDPPVLPPHLLLPGAASQPYAGEASGFPLDPCKASIGVLVEGQMAFFSLQCSERGVRGAFPQKTRSDGPSTRLSGDFFATSSSCGPNRSEGTEIWSAHGGSVPFQRQAAQV